MGCGSSALSKGSVGNQAERSWDNNHIKMADNGDDFDCTDHFAATMNNAGAVPD